MLYGEREMVAITDADLVRQLQQGDIEALGLLFDRYRTLVYRTTLGITGDPEAASDLLQDVFLRLHRYINHIDIERPLEPFLYRMSANLSYTWVKRNRRWMHYFEDFFDWLAGENENSPHEHAERSEEWHQLRKALQNLPVQQRVVVVLYYLNDLSLSEIAEILEVPEGTVKSRLHYGRISLRKSLGKSGIFDGDALPGLNIEG
jgi:RNA polymerase sigma-70 factor, ECF subfamily